MKRNIRKSTQRNNRRYKRKNDTVKCKKVIGFQSTVISPFATYNQQFLTPEEAASYLTQLASEDKDQLLEAARDLGFYVGEEIEELQTIVFNSLQDYAYNRLKQAEESDEKKSRVDYQNDCRYLISRLKIILKKLAIPIAVFKKDRKYMITIAVRCMFDFILDEMCDKQNGYTLRPIQFATNVIELKYILRAAYLSIGLEMENINKLIENYREATGASASDYNEDRPWYVHQEVDNLRFDCEELLSDEEWGKFETAMIDEFNYKFRRAFVEFVEAAMDSYLISNGKPSRMEWKKRKLNEDFEKMKEKDKRKSLAYSAAKHFMRNDIDFY